MLLHEDICNEERYPKLGFLEIIDIMPQQRKELQEKLPQRNTSTLSHALYLLAVSEISFSLEKLYFLNTLYLTSHTFLRVFI